MALAVRRCGMTLFSGRSDVYSHQVRWVIAEKGLEVDVVEVAPGAIPEDLAYLNPGGSVPTLLDRELVLYEPMVILEYLDERYPHPPLLPSDPVSRARTRLTLFRVEKELYGRMSAILAAGKNAATARKELAEYLAVLEPALEKTRFFMSDELTLVDCALAPLLWRLPQMKIELPKQAKALGNYAARVFKRPSFRLSLTEAEKVLRG
ncbi:MAG: glutathione S-transferase N-terminal domain-containing protein [Thiohalomonadaceae bacterium]